MGVNNQINKGAPQSLNEVVLIGNRIILDADNYIEFNRDEQTIGFWKRVGGDMTLISGMASDAILIGLANGIDSFHRFQFQDNDGILQIYTYNPLGDTIVEFSKDGISYNLPGETPKNYSLPTGEESRIATIIDIEQSSGGVNQRSTSTSGTESAPDTSQKVIFIHEAGVTASLTYNFPPNPVDSQEVTVMSVGGVTALTLLTAVGSIINTITTLAVGGFATYRYLSSQSKWYKIG